MTPSQRIAALAVSALSVIISGALLIAAGVEAVRYSPYENPGALGVAVWLGAIALIILAVPVAAGVVLILLPAVRQYGSWKRALSPRERIAVQAAEFAALEGMHLIWSHHNREVAERLTESVMGAPRPGEPGWRPHPGWGLEDVLK